MKIACTISLLLLTCSVRSQDLPITPYPEKVVMGTGSFTISPKTALVLPNGSIAWRQAVGPLTDKLKLVAGFGLPLASAAPASNGILGTPNCHRLSFEHGSGCVDFWRFHNPKR